MPWQVERVGETLHVRIAAPVRDWPGLMEEVVVSLEPRPDVILIPEAISGGDETDNDLLQILCSALGGAMGMPLRREAGSPSAEDRPRQRRSSASHEAPAAKARPRSPSRRFTPHVPELPRAGKATAWHSRLGGPYHDDLGCKPGNTIEDENRVWGRGDRPHCKVCADAQARTGGG